MSESTDRELRNSHFKHYVKHQLKIYNNRLLNMQKSMQEYPAAVLLRESNYMVVAYQEVFAQVHAALYEKEDSKATPESMRKYSLRRGRKFTSSLLRKVLKW